MYQIQSCRDATRSVFTSPAMTFRECIQDAISAKASLADADLRHQDLCDLDFSDMNLHGADLSYSHARNTSFNAADLRGATMVHVHATAAAFNQAWMPRVHAAHGQFLAAKFDDTDCAHANFSLANFSGARLVSTRLPRAVLSGALLGEAFVRNVVFTDAQLQHYVDNLVTLFSENAEVALYIRDYVAALRYAENWDGRIPGLYDVLVRMGMSRGEQTALMEDCPQRFTLAVNWFQRFRGDNLEDAYRQQEVERTLLWVNDWIHSRTVHTPRVPTVRPAQRRLALPRKEE